MISYRIFNITFLALCPLFIESANAECPDCQKLETYAMLLENIVCVKKQLSRETEARNIILEEQNEQLMACNKQLLRELEQQNQRLIRLTKEYGNYKKRVEYEEEIRRLEEWIIDEHGRLSLEKLQQKSPYT